MSVVVGSQQQQQSEAEQSQVRRLNLAAESSQNAVQAQHLFVMRHGHRLDTADRKWRLTAERPFDTPITGVGEAAAYQRGKIHLRGKDIKLVLSSPFLRCLQTADQVARALQLPGISSTCNGMCEIMCTGSGIDSGVDRRSGNESSSSSAAGLPKFPDQEMVEKHKIRLLEEDTAPLPEAQETIDDARKRYNQTLRTLADKHWPHNLLVVTHEYGVIEAMALGRAKGEYEASYCGYVELCRSEEEREVWAVDHYVDVFQYESFF